jgi:hypothetical protein
LNRHILLRDRGHFDWNDFSGAATPTTAGPRGCRPIAEESPQQDKHQQQQHDTDYLDDADAGLPSRRGL